MILKGLHMLHALLLGTLDYQIPPPNTYYNTYTYTLFFFFSFAGLRCRRWARHVNDYERTRSITRVCHQHTKHNNPPVDCNRLLKHECFDVYGWRFGCMPMGRRSCIMCPALQCIAKVKHIYICAPLYNFFLFPPWSWRTEAWTTLSITATPAPWSWSQAYNCVCFYPVIVRPLLLYTKYIYTRTRTRTRLECTHRGGEACRYHKPSDTCVVRDVWRHRRP